MGSLQLTHKELEGLTEELKEKSILSESLKIAARARKDGGGEQKRGLGKVAKSKRYQSGVQECLYESARVLNDPILAFAKLETSELSFNWSGVAWSWKNPKEIMGGSEEGTVFVV